MLFSQNLSLKLTLIAAVFLCFITCQVLAAEQLKIMSFNVWSVENTQAGRDHIVNVINSSGADVVGFQELSNPTLIAGALGWNLQSQPNSGVNIISRYPIVEASPSAWGAKIQLSSGTTVWVFNTHLPAYPYQPYDLRDNTLAKSETAVINAATSARGSALTQVLNDIAATNAINSGSITFLTGDFNEPSCLDWTQAVADATARSYDLKVQWPSSKRIIDARLTDSLRKLSPNPITDNSYTWTPRPASNEVHDRIDIVYYAGLGVTPTAVSNIGPADGSPDTDIVYANYPSDHRAVLATFTCTPDPVDAGKNILTTLDLAGSLQLDGTISISGDTLTINWQAFSVSPSGVLSATSNIIFSDPTNPDTIITAGQAGNYILKLNATLNGTTYSDQVELRVYADTCQAAKATGTWQAAYYDRNSDCNVDLADLAQFAMDWLNNSSLATTRYYAWPYVGTATVLAGLAGTTNDTIPVNHGTYVQNTPHIAITWSPSGGSNNSNNQWELYNDWPNGGTGGMVYQMGSMSDHDYKTHSIAFKPDEGYNVQVNSLDLNIWPGGGMSNVSWTVTGSVSGSHGSGIFTTADGNVATHQININGISSETLTLSLDQKSGKGSYIALDNLSFSEIRPLN